MLLSTKRLALAVAAAVAVLSSPLAAQEWRGRARVEGTVKSTKGEAIPGAKVSLRWGKSGHGGPDLTTDKAGHWIYFGLAGGPWDLDFEAQGYQTKKISAEFQEVARNPSVDVQLEPEAGAQGAHEEFQVGGKKISKEAVAALEAGNAAMQARNWAEARENYLKALAEMPDNVNLLVRIAAAYSGEGNADKAIEYAKKATEVDPQNDAAWRMIAETELSRGNLDAGKEALNKVPVEKITDPTAYLNLGILLYNKKQNEAAEEAFGKAVAVSPDLADAYYYRGLARISLKKNADAKADFKKYLELSPDGPEANDVKELLKSLS